MKLMYGNVPVKSLNIHSYELNTNDCDMVASDLQAGKTAVARGQKITGTGKSFEFASYGDMYTNDPWPIPDIVNIVEIGCMDYPIKLRISLNSMKGSDFSSTKTVSDVVIGDTAYPITVNASNNLLTIGCDYDETIQLQVFYGKDRYV